MTNRRIAPPLLALLLTAFAPGNVTALRAPILPEVEKHLVRAEEAIGRKQYETALAHCDLVLVGSEITYSIVLDGVHKEQRSQLEKATDHATEAWEKALDGRVSFRRVEGRDANVVIVFRPQVNLRGEPVAGLLNWKRAITQDNGTTRGRFTSEMQIRTQGLDFRPMPAEAIRHTVTHEMGHVFGLEDTDQVGELMGPLNVNHPLHGPRSHEIEAVRNLRDQADGIRGNAARFLIR